MRPQFSASEKYRTFKGIFIESTKTYYLCDFYELEHPHTGVEEYKIIIEVIGQPQVVVHLHKSEGQQWALSGTQLTEQLKDRLIQIIEEQ